MTYKKSRSHALWVFPVGLGEGEGVSAKRRTMEKLEDRIPNVNTNVPHEFLQKAVDSLPGSLRKLADAAGAYI